MEKFKKGDKVNIRDGSYIFGIQNGEYSEYCNNRDKSRKNLTVIRIGLTVLCKLDRDMTGTFSVVNDMLVTDNYGDYWFTQSRFCNPAESNHTIIIDGKSITLSHKSFLALKEQLV